MVPETCTWGRQRPALSKMSKSWLAMVPSTQGTNSNSANDFRKDTIPCKRRAHHACGCIRRKFNVVCARSVRVLDTFTPRVPERHIHAFRSCNFNAHVGQCNRCWQLKKTLVLNEDLALRLWPKMHEQFDELGPEKKSLGMATWQARWPHSYRFLCSSRFIWI